MNSSKVIEISKSSLVGLKAELLKKQEEVKKIKELRQEQGLKPVVRQKKKTQLDKSNDGVEKRSLNDTESLEDFDALKKSREVLEAKSRLYDKLKNSGNTGNEKSQYLIDFDLKRMISQQHDKSLEEMKESNQQPSDNESYHSDPNSDPENDWVDFMDTLGRSRRCLRSDLPEMKSRDSTLAASLKPPPELEVSPEMISWDMQREIMRRKWEEQETILLGKKDVHYQDVLFDEARDHGVGYFEFSTDEAERIRQQEALKNLRNETMAQQEAAVGLRLRRKQQLQARLAAAHKRRRERLGLPPEEPEEESLDTEIIIPSNKEVHKKEENVEELEEAVKRIAPVRPWDIGKETGTPVMSQEEWVEKKRHERPEEFAPPANFNYDGGFSSKKLNHKHCSTFKKKTILPSVDKATMSTSVKVENQVQSIPSNKSKWKPTCSQIDELLSKSKEKYFGNTGIMFSEQDFGRSNPQSESQTEDTCIGPSLEDWKGQFSRESVMAVGNNGPGFKSGKTLEKLKNSKNLLHKNKKHTKCKEMEESSYTNNSMDSYSLKSNVGPPNTSKRKWAEVPPPASMSYYIDGSVQHKPKTIGVQMMDSIAVGMNYLKSRTDENVQKRVKGLLDIV